MRWGVVACAVNFNTESKFRAEKVENIAANIKQIS
jgi:hypothetical protein